MSRTSHLVGAEHSANGWTLICAAFLKMSRQDNMNDSKTVGRDGDDDEMGHRAGASEELTIPSLQEYVLVSQDAQEGPGTGLIRRRFTRGVRDRCQGWHASPRLKHARAMAGPRHSHSSMRASIL